ncbi:amidase family protein [Actinomadura sp. 6K520]|uniref:amidase family protein n=1 Tax=Actinomadura sp. 6K520 TaxID=2530364 RepID=UPI0010520924|nr:amidase family protein [Actinomadura sp. 6K520]TDE33668.1 amidase [Actinomadura sp. 6K520]
MTVGGACSCDDGSALDRATIPGLQRCRTLGCLDAVGLTEAYLDRIGRLDGVVRAVLALDPTAIAQAAASDRRRKAGKLRGPLDGIPVLLKDNIDTAGLPTTAGSRALARGRPARDAELVRRLRAAGAVILGKANLSEWGNFRSSGAVSGWSAVGGQTRNPHAPDRSPSGSSSGPAAGVAAGFAQVAVGTETDGSLVCPAGTNGVVGVKPSRGLVGVDGVVPVCRARDCAGPIARNVVDTALALSVLAPGTRGLVPSDQPSALRAARIGLWRMPAYGEDVDRLMTRVGELLRERGAEVVEVDVEVERTRDLLSGVLPTEFRRDIEDYLRTRDDGPGGLAELIDFHRDDPLERTCFAGLDLFEQSLAAPGPEDPGYRARRAELARRASRSIDDLLTRHRLDALAAPTNPPARPIDCRTGDDGFPPTSTPAAVAGYPSVSVPAGFVGPLPVGVSFMAGRRADARVLALAAAYERAADARRPPRIATSPTDPV